MFTVKEAATKLRVSVSTMYSLAKERRIPHCRIGVGRGRLMFHQQDIDEYLGSCRVRADSPTPAARFTHARYPAAERR